MKHRVKASVIFVVLALVTSSGVSQVSTASLEIEVVGEADDPLPGVTVDLVNTATGLRRSAVTDDGGGVVLLALPAGEYEITASLEGMAAPASQAFVLHVGQRARLNLVLEPQVADLVTVTDEVPLIDVHRMDSSENILPEQIDSLPVADRQFEKLAFLSPGVQRDRTAFFDRTGAPVIGGAGNAAVATVLVNGADFTDGFIGQSRLRLSQDSIREFRVVGQGFDAEVGGTSGGGLSIVTKSGTNDIRGTVFAFARDEALREKKELALEEADYSRTHLGFTIGGPLVVDRSHYFGAFEHVDEDEVALVRPGGAFTDFATDVVRPRRQTTALLALDHSFSARSTGSAKIHWERYRRDNYEVGGVVDESHGWSWNRDVWTLVAGHTWILGSTRLNEFRVQLGERDAGFPTNSQEIGEWFTYGNTLQTGGHYLDSDGGLRGSFAGVQATHHWQLEGGRHSVKAGFSYQRIDDRYEEDRFEAGLMLYEDDTNQTPFLYFHGGGPGVANLETDLIGAFVQDDIAFRENLTLSLGVRYDLDTESNLPDLEHPLIPGDRDVDVNNLQPRLGFTWDLKRDGRRVVRGGFGRFVGRYTHYPTFSSLAFNDQVSRTIFRRVSLPEYGIFLDPADPKNTGFGLPPSTTLLASSYPAPESDQARLGIMQQLGDSDLFLDVEAVYSRGRNEPFNRNINWKGNDDPGWQWEPYRDVDTFTKEGRSRYEALFVNLKGRLEGGHLITGGLAIADKKNMVNEGGGRFEPSDAADVEGEWGRSDIDERYRLVLSGIFTLPWGLDLAAIYEYGSGRPWDRDYGYDYNGDFYASDRLQEASRNDQDGPRFSQLDLMLSKRFGLSDRGSLELSLEVFNLLNTVNYDVRSVDGNKYFAGPTLADPDIPSWPNPGFGTYRDTHRPREVQLGLRWRS